MKRVILLGASGSIGKQAIDVISRHKDSLELVAASVHQNTQFLDSLKQEFPNMKTCISHNNDYALKNLIEQNHADIVLNAIAGAAGLLPSLYAIRSGKDLALSNKESMVMAGRLITTEALKLGKKIIPVDSEHSAIFNLLERFGDKAVSELIITASGGPFRNMPLEELPNVKLEDALKHPTWNMGKKITIDSATMANKGLEVIEAARLFDMATANIKVVIHPESKVHSLIRTHDSAMYAQISRPDMRLPILNALLWPVMHNDKEAHLNLCDGPLTFYEPDFNRYPLLQIAYEAINTGEGHCCAYNAANEVAVDAFMQGLICFTDIAAIVKSVLNYSFLPKLDTIEAVLDCDVLARNTAKAALDFYRS